jgi:hypothetical protein
MSKRHLEMARSGIPDAKPGATRCRNPRFSAKRCRKIARLLKKQESYAKVPVDLLDDMARKLL